MPVGRSWLFAIACWLIPVAAFAQPPGSAYVESSAEPAKVVLSHAGDRQLLVVTGKKADGSLHDLTGQGQHAAADAKIAQVDARGVVTPLAAGTTAITIQGPGFSLSVPVTVASAAARPVSFANDVMPVLARFGCNSGACHGAAQGKKGFKLSLRGYDPASDYVNITRTTEGRRLNFVEPHRSLLVLKATGQVAHDGAMRFDANSRYAKLLERWQQENVANDLAEAPKLEAVEVFPSFRGFAAARVSQQLQVTARFSDGSRRDVTAEALFTSSNENLARVDEDGLVQLAGKGEATISVRYGSKLALATLVALPHDPSFVWPTPPETNYIDRLVHDKLKKLHIIPSEPSKDTEFLRRVYYDLLGIPPTSAEIRAFLKDDKADKRARVIDALLERPEHAEYWALKWSDLFRVRFDTLRDRGTWGLYRWLRDSIAANKPYDQFVKELVTADGSCAENAPANFYRVFDNANEASEATVQIFFGIRLLCARCHDHPFEKWVQTDYYGMSAFFSQVARKPGGRREDLVIHRTPGAAQSRHSTTGATVLPKYLDAAFEKVAEDQDARDYLAQWMTRKDNPFLARAAVNRFWSFLFGKGIIDPVDDIRSSNPPSNGPLLDALTKDFIDSNYDVRRLLRTMLNSQTYQRSARQNASNAEDTTYFSRAIPRRLGAEQVLDTLVQATGIREGFRTRFGEGGAALPAAGLRAGALPDRQLTAEMLDILGRPRGESSCACERVEEISMTLALHLINGQSLNRRLTDAGNRLVQLTADAKKSDAEVIEEIYLSVVCRPPSAGELANVQAHFVRAASRAQAAQDLQWALFNSKEFLFNH